MKTISIVCDLCGVDMNKKVEHDHTEMMADIGLFLELDFWYNKKGSNISEQLRADEDICTICLWKDYIRLKKIETKSHYKPKKETVKLVCKDSVILAGDDYSCGFKLKGC